MAHYNRGRYDPTVVTPRTTRYNRERRRREESDSDSSDNSDRWREEYAQVQEIWQMYQHQQEQDSDNELVQSLESPSSENESLGVRHEQVFIEESESNASSYAAVSVNEDNKESTDSTIDDIDDVRRNVHDLLLEELDDEDASEEDLFDYQEIIENPLIRAGNRLQEILDDDDAVNIIGAQIDVSKVEIFISILKFSLVYHLPQSAIADLLKMFNVFFGTADLPQTRYMIDKIFNDISHVDYFALCPNCKNYVGRFDREQDRNAYCGLCNLNFSLKDPTYTDFFCIINPQSEIVYYLEENWSYYESVIEARTRDQEDVNEFHSGLICKKLRNLLPNHKKDRFVTVTFNSDASPVFESSAFSVTPIQIMINDLPFKLRTSNPIVCGLYFGKSKIDMNVFFEPFVMQMNTFSDEGIVCNIRGTDQTIYVYAVCSCVDSIARAPMQGLTQFNGYYGCNWCLHPGYYIAVGRGGSVKYILVDEEVVDRNDADTRQQMREAVESGQTIMGVMNYSVLCLLQYFDIILGFVPDPMHFIDLGIGKQYMKSWIDVKNMSYSLSNVEIDMIDNFMKALKVPYKLVRNSRSIRDRRFWKAKEYQNWILFYSTVALLMFPRMRAYMLHWCHLVRAYYILLQDNITRDQLREAHRLLVIFVTLTEAYYGRSAMTYNLHQCLHVVQSVINFGSLYQHFGYGFENGNGEIVKEVQAAKGVLHQICRVTGMRKSELVLKKFLLQNHPHSNVLPYVEYLEKKECIKVLKTDIGRYFGVPALPTDQWIAELNLSNSAVLYLKLVKNECTYLSCNKVRLRTNNSFAKTIDNIFIQIVFFIVDTVRRKEYTICKSVNVVNIMDIDTYIPDFQIKRILSIDQNLRAIDTGTIDRTCVHMNCQNESYLCALPNVHSY